MGVDEHRRRQGWFDPPLVRPDLDPDYAALVHTHSSGETIQPEEGIRWTYSSAYGYTGKAATTVELEDDNGITERQIESPLGVFIVVADGTRRAVLRVRRADGSVLLETDFSPPKS